MRALFDNLCPNCEGEIGDDRLEMGLPCPSCLPEPVKEPFPELVFTVGKKLKEKKQWRILEDVVRETEGYSRLFESVVGSKPWNAQLTWAKRFFMGLSFSISAPTGLGKTAFGSVMARYLEKKGKRSYIIVPTRVLVEQVVKYLDNPLYYHSEMKAKEKREFEERLKNGDFSVLVTTTQFLSRRFNDLKPYTFDFIFVDDVDAFLKNSRNIDKVLLLLGFTEEDIEGAWEAIRRRMRGEYVEYTTDTPHGQIIVSSATGTVRGLRVRLFRELLDFEVGSSRITIRNLEHVSGGEIGEIFRVMGPGGIVFVVPEYRDRVEEIMRAAEQAGLRVKTAFSEEALEALESFAKGETDVIIGAASYYGAVLRGVDLPERVRYVVFVGVPRFSFPLSFEEVPENRLRFFVNALKDLGIDVPRTSDPEKLREFLVEKFSDATVVEKLNSQGRMVIKGNRVLVPDYRTYVQGSGRASRLYPGGLTKGVSFVIVDEEGLFRALRRYMEIVYGERFREWKEVDFEALKREIEESRKKGERVEVKSLLFIVESPNKARTIARFFGRPSVIRRGALRAYEIFVGKYLLTVVATGGHVFDLVTDRGFHGVLVPDMIPVYTTLKRCPRCGTQTVERKCPVCGSETVDAIERINTLRELALQSDEVIVGTDPDTEGEKIAWDVYLAVKPYAKGVSRAEFHEVTRRAILQALEERRAFDINRVLAQMVRRVEDRWIGFQLSRKLWEKFNNNRLSAGRVQTPVLGWIVERYREHREKRISVAVNAGIRVYFETDFRKKEEVNVGDVLHVEWKDVREEEVNPPPPFTTDAMLREACARLSLSAQEVMRLAQDLFEYGLITYHRTDSTRISPEGIAVARIYIEEKYPGKFRGRSWGEGGAHEGIRPTKPMDTGTLIEYLREGELNYELSRNHLRLYDLIFKRFMASQMVPARVKKARVVFICGNLRKEEDRVVEIMEPGFYELLRKPEVPPRPGEYPVDSYRIYLIPRVPLYTEAEVVALMRERGIGRPSTYATILSKLFERRYVIESGKNRKLVPTRLGISVYEYLSANYGPLVSEERTRILEETMDAIERGEKDYLEVLREVYEEVQGI